MTKLLTFLTAAISSIAVSASSFGGSLSLMGVGGPAAGGASAPTLDGSAHSTAGASASNTVTLTTTQTNDEIIVFAAVNTCAGGTDSVAVTSSHLTFTLRKSTSTINCGGNDFLEFYAQAASALTSEVITVTVSPGAGVNYLELMAFGVHGINTGTPFDSNASLPASASSGTLSMSTSHATDFVFAGFRLGSSTSPDAGWTTITAGSFVSSEYMRVTSTQSGLTPVAATATTAALVTQLFLRSADARIFMALR